MELARKLSKVAVDAVVNVQNERWRRVDCGLSWAAWVLNSPWMRPHKVRSLRDLTIDEARNHLVVPTLKAIGFQRTHQLSGAAEYDSHLATCPTEDGNETTIAVYLTAPNRDRPACANIHQIALADMTLLTNGLDYALFIHPLANRRTANDDDDAVVRFNLEFLRQDFTQINDIAAAHLINIRRDVTDWLRNNRGRHMARQVLRYLNTPPDDATAKLYEAMFHSGDYAAHKSQFERVLDGLDVSI